MEAAGLTPIGATGHDREVVDDPSTTGAPRPGGALAGRLLVASTRLDDPNFEGAVLMLLDHGEDGALGVVLNQPTPVPVEEILEPWRSQAELAPPGVIFRGGPVSPDAVIGLARATGSGSEMPGWREVAASVATVDLSVPPGLQPVELGGTRLFSGYAGWAPGQLEAEIDDAAWFVLPVLASDVFCSSPERLWHDVLRRQGGKLSMLATFPRHPTLN